MEGVALENFNKFKSSTIPLAQFYSHLYDESDKDSITNARYFLILIQLLRSKGFIASFLTTLWYHVGGCAKQYHCAHAIYILSCLALYLFIDIDREVGAFGHVNFF